MEQYGAFAEIIRRLEDNLRDVRIVWTDKTAASYEPINQNMQHFAIRIWELHNTSDKGYNAVKAVYDEGEFEDRLRQLNSKIASV